ncbi:hypothetical protein X466_08225 [Oenococcus oeni S25]|uniref:Uncharacterized protein n=1 Tax=Oenococcus oeni TaxID=1247 RepID=A0A6N4A848_OENOE|nr:hypothetical protein [Oenococcus oeni]KGO16619.1 hypothetical protein OA32_03375 [Oenococcus oeni X2L]AVI93879.1 hypothetical protein AX764_03085 [Oenococcus oeni]KGH56947.1 hypothetical protein X463_00925 [Oenococcus oeni S22]KGH69149.1 hypothetical protein X466_08225 [Oenococcus oeni S25]KGH80899.1 hypothetical protein X281_00385 [Oenococcus oeni IOEB_0607]
MSKIATATLFFSNGEKLKITENDKLGGLRPHNADEVFKRHDERVYKSKKEYFDAFPKEFSNHLLPDLSVGVDATVGLLDYITDLIINYGFFYVGDDIKNVYSTSAIVKIQNAFEESEN